MLITLFFLLYLQLDQSTSFAVEDNDKRGFNELTPIHIDVDGDGRPDTIRPRTFARRSTTAERRWGLAPRTTHWITFDLPLSTGSKRASFFTYRYGDDRADYWVWALKPAGDLNRDGRPDLVFYSGDDTTDETVVLLQVSGGFKASSSGQILCDMCAIDRDFNVVALGQYSVKEGRDLPNRIVARFSPHRGYFEGDGLYWVRTSRTALRERPAPSGRLLEWFGKDDAVPVVVENGGQSVKGNWIKVETAMGSGWMDRRNLVETSRWVHSPDLKRHPPY